MVIDRSDPWKDIARPERISAVSARRVDVGLLWDVFWAVDVDNRCLLILQHRSEAQRLVRLPQLRGLQVEVHPSAGGESIDRIVIRLLEQDQREIFHRFCLDIIDATRLARTEEDAVERFLTRAWRWHRLLRSGRSDELNEERQKGLLGELRVLEDHLMPILGAADAVRSWIGPLRSPKDFAIGGVYIEAKARQGTGNTHIVISSEEQLDVGESDILFLYVTELVATREDTTASVTLNDVARRLHSAIMRVDVTAADLFEERLTATGFDWDHDYSDSRWSYQGESVFRVGEGFPRLNRSMCPTGVSNVHYSIALAECEEFRVRRCHLRQAIAGGVKDDDRSG